MPTIFHPRIQIVSMLTWLLLHVKKPRSYLPWPWCNPVLACLHVNTIHGCPLVAVVAARVRCTTAHGHVASGAHTRRLLLAAVDRRTGHAPGVLARWIGRVATRLQVATRRRRAPARGVGTRGRRCRAAGGPCVRRARLVRSCCERSGRQTRKEKEVGRIEKPSGGDTSQRGSFQGRTPASEVHRLVARCSWARVKIRPWFAHELASFCNYSRGFVHPAYMESDRAAERKAIRLAHAKVLPALYARAEACQPKPEPLGQCRHAGTDPSTWDAVRKLQAKKDALARASGEDARRSLLRQWCDPCFEDVEAADADASESAPMET